MNAIEHASREGAVVVSFEGFTVYTAAVGQGAAGKVYQAHDRRLDRPVALKFLKDAEFLSADARARFVIEARVGGQLDHPNIVPVFRCNEDLEAPYLVMGWCGGGTLAEQMDGQPWEPRRAAALMRRLADAVAHAHARGVLHRDIKPSNVLFDDQEEPKLADFGLAKIKDHSTALTQAEDVHGTPAYLAPEVATHGTSASSERSDVYALGAVLFELLAGQPPFAGSGSSEILAAVRQGPSPDIRERRADLPADLAVICDRCLSRDPELRPESAERVAQELGRFVEGRPVLLKPVPLAEKLASWVRRRPQVALGSFAALLLLGILTSAVVLQWQRASHLADQLGKTVSELSAANHTLEMASLGHELSAAMEETSSSAAPKGLARLANLLRRAPEHPAVPIRARWLLNERSWIRPGGTPMEHGSEVVWALFRPGTMEVVTADMAGRLHGWDRNRITQWPDSITPSWTVDVRAPVGVMHMATDGSATLSLHDDNAARFVTFAPSPNVAVTVSNVTAIAVDPERRGWLVAEKSGRIQWGAFPSIRPEGTLELLRIEPALVQVAQAALASNNGPIAVSNSTNGVVALIDPRTGRAQQFEVLNKPAAALRFSPNGRLLLAWNQTEIAVASAVDGRVLFHGSQTKCNLRCATFSPASEHVVQADETGAVTVLQAATGRTSWTWDHPTGVNQVKFGPDPDTFFTLCDDGTLRAFNLAVGRPITPANGHEYFGWTVDVSPDGNWLASTSADERAGLWKFVRAKPLPRLELDHGIVGTAWLGGTNGLALVGTDGELHCWNPPVPTNTRRFSVGTNVVRVGGAENSGEIVLGRADGSIEVQSVSIQGAVRRLPGSFSQPIQVLRLAPSGRLLLAADLNVWRLLPMSTAAPAPLIGGPLFSPQSAAFSPDGTKVAISGMQFFVQVFDVKTGLSIGAAMQHGGPVCQIAFSPDGRRLATASQDFTARIWDVETGRPVTAPLRHPGFVYSATFAAGGSRLLTGGTLAAHLWDTTTGKEIACYSHPHEEVFQAEFTADEQRLITSTQNGAFMVWSAPLALPLTDPVLFAKSSYAWQRARFKQLPDSRGVIFWSNNTRAVWKPLPPELKPPQMADLCEFIAGRKVGRDGSVEFIPPAEMRRIEERLAANGLEPW